MLCIRFEPATAFLPLTWTQSLSTEAAAFAHSITHPLIPLAIYTPLAPYRTPFVHTWMCSPNRHALSHPDVQATITCPVRHHPRCRCCLASPRLALHEDTQGGTHSPAIFSHCLALSHLSTQRHIRTPSPIPKQAHILLPTCPSVISFRRTWVATFGKHMRW